MTATGKVDVFADNIAQITATGNNEAKNLVDYLGAFEGIKTIVSKAGFGKAGAGDGGLGAGALMATNKVASGASAWIKDTNSNDAVNTSVSGVLGVRVEANDSASVRANSEVVAQSIAQNTIDGLKVVLPIFGLDEYDFTNASGTQELESGDLIRFVATYGNTASTAKGTNESMYEYVGEDGSVDLGDASIDYDTDTRFERLEQAD